MLISHTWLQSFFDEKLPSADEVADKLMFHAWEIEEVTEKDDEKIIEVNVLPDTAAWALSHRGVAKNLAVILGTKLSRDSLAEAPAAEPKSENISIDIQSPKCRRYSALRIDGVKVGESPDWLKERLIALGQKPINNIVDATNYVMFDMGQPLHAFDADLLGGNDKDSIVVRDAKDGESIITLTGESYELTEDDLLIVDGSSDASVGIAGIKGGKAAEVTERTTNILLEAANFDHVSVRRTSARLKLRTDASQRYENGVVSDLTMYGLRDVANLITDIAGGEVVGYQDEYPEVRTIAPATVTLSHVNSLLGVALKAEEVSAILDRFQYAYSLDGETFTVTPPVERPDLVIAEDLVEEIGRVYGYEHVDSVTPDRIDQTELNKRFYYAEKVRGVLTELGFSEVFTSSFRNKDTIALKNALASDKGCLRSSLLENMDEVLEKNRVNADLLEVSEIRTFEIGTVFTKEGEHTALAVGVRSPGGYKPKKDDPVLVEAGEAITTALEIQNVTPKNGIFEIDLDAAIESLPEPTVYEPFVKEEDITYVSFSLYPFVSRDIAFWVSDNTTAEDAEAILRENGGDLLTRVTLFDTFEKDGKTSYAFRLIFQSHEKTLTDDEVNQIMDQITSVIDKRGWEVR